jgi:hypothetical protein
MPFRETVAVYCENHTEHTNTYSVGKTQSFHGLKKGFRSLIRYLAMKINGETEVQFHTFLTSTLGGGMSSSHSTALPPTKSLSRFFCKDRKLFLASTNRKIKIKTKYTTNAEDKMTSRIKNCCYISPLQVVEEDIPILGQTRYDLYEMYTGWNYPEISLSGNKSVCARVEGCREERHPFQDDGA